MSDVKTEAHDQALALRHEYRACVKIAQDTDSKKEAASLTVEAKGLLERLRKVCPHEETIVLNSYSPSYSWDEDANPERRICLCCGVRDEMYYYNGTPEKKPLILLHPKGHWNARKGSQIDLKEPLKYLLSECLEDVRLYR